jgi:hypothetical protein
MLRSEGLTKRLGHTQVTGYALSPRTPRALQPIRSFRQLNAFANVMIGRTARPRFCVLDYLQVPARRQQHQSPRDCEGERVRHHEAV